MFLSWQITEDFIAAYQANYGFTKDGDPDANSAAATKPAASDSGTKPPEKERPAVVSQNPGPDQKEAKPDETQDVKQKGEKRKAEQGNIHQNKQHSKWSCCWDNITILFQLRFLWQLKCCQLLSWAAVSHREQEVHSLLAASILFIVECQWMLNCSGLEKPVLLCSPADQGQTKIYSGFFFNKHHWPKALRDIRRILLPNDHTPKLSHNNKMGKLQTAGKCVQHIVLEGHTLF